MNRPPRVESTRPAERQGRTDEAQDDGRELGGLEGGVGPELVSGLPEAILKVAGGVLSGGWFGPVHLGSQAIRMAALGKSRGALEGRFYGRLHRYL